MKNKEELLKRAMKMLDDVNIDYAEVTEVIVNSRAKKRWGRSIYNGDGSYTIEISSRLLADSVSDTATMNTMIHELLHCHKDCRSHTGEWKRRAEIVNRNYPELSIKRVTPAEEKGLDSYKSIETPKWVITCTACGRKHYYRRTSKVVRLVQSNRTSCRCGYCGNSKLLIEAM